MLGQLLNGDEKDDKAEGFRMHVLKVARAR